MKQKVFIIACEASADSHGEKLIEALKEQDPHIEFKGLGGPLMKKAGMPLVHDMTTLSALGFGDVLRQYFKYRKIFYKTLAEATTWKPTAYILIDSPAFNLRFAKKIRGTDKTTPILYYICPQLWAWGKRRIGVVKKNISKMFSILPFEVEFYKKESVDCEFVGHPLIEETTHKSDREKIRKGLLYSPETKVIGILPGSREREVHRILPIMLESAQLLHERMPETTFLLARYPNINPLVYDKYLEQTKIPMQSFSNDFNSFVSAMDFALVTSGTATLQTALLNVPLFLLYKASLSTYLLGKQLIRVPYLGLVNLLAEKSVIPEFIQGKAKAKTIAHEAEVLLKNKDLYEGMKKEFKNIREHLIRDGNINASETAAKSILKYLNSPQAPRETPDPESAYS